jgi:hypothetical protein
MARGLKDRIGQICRGTPRLRARRIDQTPIFRTSSGPAVVTGRMQQAAYMSAPDPTPTHRQAKPLHPGGPSIHVSPQFSFVHTAPRTHACRKSHRVDIFFAPSSTLTPWPNPHSACRTARVPPSRDFVPWRFSDAGARARQWFRAFRRPKTCTTPDSAVSRGVLVHEPTFTTQKETQQTDAVTHDLPRTFFTTLIQLLLAPRTLGQGQNTPLPKMSGRTFREKFLNVVPSPSPKMSGLLRSLWRSTVAVLGKAGLAGQWGRKSTLIYVKVHSSWAV